MHAWPRCRDAAIVRHDFPEAKGMTFRRRISILALTAAAAFVAGDASAQVVQVPVGMGTPQIVGTNNHPYFSLVDSGPVARAQAALAADPTNVEKIVALGTAQAGARMMREAVATFTQGLRAHPNDALLLRWRGHRNLSVRDFAKAKADLERGARLDSTIYGIWYHLGVLRYVQGDFNGAARAFRKAMRNPPDGGELAGATDWLWMSLMRAGRTTEARVHLTSRPDTLPTTAAYKQRLALYRGEIGPEQLFGPGDTSDVNVATLSYGLGNWYLLKGDTTRARAAFERAIASGGWPAFGFIAAEQDLRRLARPKKRR
jgi:tetratricopeptide (TPR) repeat protein